MKIKRLQASFGNLQNDELRLDSGLNIIEAPNEYGKSTWCAFIRAMLYGVNTSLRDRQDTLSDKTRYRPWSGSPMEGSMEISFNGRDITIRRTGTPASPMKRFSAVYTETNEPVSGLSGEDAGEILTGASEHVFERTAFIRQSGIRVEQAYELEKRISSLVSSGDEHTSYTEAEELLRAWRRLLRHNKSGILPLLEAKLSAAEEKIALLENETEVMSGLRYEVKRLDSLREQLEKDLDTHEIFQERAAAKRVLQAKADLKKAEEELKARQTAAEQYSGVTPEAVTGLKERAAALSALEPLYSRAKEEHSRSEMIYLRALDAKKASPLSELSEADARGLMEKAACLAAEAAAPAPKHKAAAIAIPAALAIIAVLLAITLQNTVGYVASAAIIAVAVLLFASKRPGGKTEAAEAQNALQEKYGYLDLDELQAGIEEYLSLCRAAEKAEAALTAARQSFEASEASVLESETVLLEMAGAIFPAFSDMADLPAMTKEAETVVGALKKAEFEFTSASNYYSAVSESYEGHPEEVDFSYIPVPMRSREDTMSALARVNTQLADAKSSLDLKTGELKSFGAPELISGELRELIKERAVQTEKYNALTSALEVLAEANTDMQTRFSPLISCEASAVLARLTDGKYDRLSFNRKFTAEAKSRSDSVSRSALSLSVGTVDQVYLALRLAMCRLLLSEGEKSPVVLDDALANFDEKRALSALRLLKEIAAERQILLFTCHSRESKMLSGDKEVNIIRLQSAKADAW